MERATHRDSAGASNSKSAKAVSRWRSAIPGPVRAPLTLLAEHLGNLRDVVVGVLSRPQASLADFYRELGHLFSVPLAPHNRWASAKALREKWLHHIENSLYRPVLLIDEAQEMTPSALCELRLLSSVELDSRSILTTVLAGDLRLAHRWKRPTSYHRQPHPGPIAHRSPGPVPTAPVFEPPAQDGR